MAVKGVIVDLDGCVYIGDKPVSGASVALKKLKSRGTKILFFTNNATRTPKEYLEKLMSMGIEVSLSEIMTSSIIAASYIKRVYGPSRVYVVGTRALEEVIESYGHEIVDSNPNVVVVGLDFDFNYQKLSKASKEIRRGAKFIATNADATIPVENDVLPGAGSIVKAIEVASGVRPIIVGKPSRIALKEALLRLKLRPEEVLVVGDRPETDVKMGKRLKCKTALVLTGITKERDVEALPEKMKPDFIIKSLEDLPFLLNVIH